VRTPLILVADDNVHNLYLARFLLEKKGYRVCEAHNGEEAVALCQAEAPALILMDIQMPGMDGLEATHCIKSNTSTPPLIVALTARAMSGDREIILAAGCDGYIEKPIDPGNFIARVENYLPEPLV